MTITLKNNQIQKLTKVSRKPKGKNYVCVFIE